jgi:hypothetical protein
MGESRMKIVLKEVLVVFGNSKSGDVGVIGYCLFIICC